jgi:hypothetical protein
MNLEQQLAEKTSALRDLEERWRKNIADSDLRNAYSRLSDEVLDIQRAIADRKGLAYASKWNIPEIWHGMTLGCLIVGGQLGCCVIFETEPKSKRFNVLEFKMITGYKLTEINDEVMEAHPFTGRGLTAYGAFVICNSPWLLEIETVNKNHPQYNSKHWRNVQHYMLCFKDRIFEVLAKEFALVGTYQTIQEASGAALKRIL